MTDYQATETQPLLRRKPVQGAWHRAIVFGACAMVGCVAIAAVSAGTVSRRPLAAAAPSEISDETVRARSVGNARARSGADVSARAAGSRTSAMGNSEVFHESSWASDAWDTVDFLHWFHRDRHAQEDVVEAPPSPLSPPPPSPPPLDFHHVDFPHKWPGTKGCEATCESEFVDQSQCEGMFYCEWDGERCWSAVGTNPCPEDEDEMQSMFDSRDERIAGGDDDPDHHSMYAHEYPGMNGCETTCEGDGVSEEFCKFNFFCEWDGARCWSAVGPNPCPADDAEMQSFWLQSYGGKPGESNTPHQRPDVDEHPDSAPRGCEVECEAQSTASACGEKFYCTWDGQGCWSSVGAQPCPGTQDEMFAAWDAFAEQLADGYPGQSGCALECEGDDVDADACSGKFYCAFFAGKCFSIVGEDECPASEEDMFDDMYADNGFDHGHHHGYPGASGCEAACEGENVDEATCATRFYCTWDAADGRCWSAVGSEDCPTSEEDMYAMFRDNAAGSAAALGVARNAVRRGVARKVATR